jgi:simple sugar transport system ATP-binding protein
MESPERGPFTSGARASTTSPPTRSPPASGWCIQHFNARPAMTGRGERRVRRAWPVRPAPCSSPRTRLGQATGLSLEPEAFVRDLAVRGQQRVELLKVLSRDARVLIFDEPTAVLAPAEAEDLASSVASSGGRRPGHHPHHTQAPRSVERG